MKMFALAAAAAVAVTGLAPVALTTPVAAQRTVVTERTVVRTDHHEYRGDRDHRGWRNRQVCHWEHHRHRNVRVCRSVRFR